MATTALDTRFGRRRGRALLDEAGPAILFIPNRCLTRTQAAAAARKPG